MIVMLTSMGRALSNNELNGTLDIGDSYSNSLALNLQNNSITSFQQQAGYKIELMYANLLPLIEFLAFYFSYQFYKLPLYQILEYQCWVRS